MEAHGLADAHALADRDGPLVVGADIGAHEEVAALVLGAVLVDHDARADALRRQRLLVLGQSSIASHQAVHRRLARELPDDVPSRR